jgi:hypothetical protein
LRSLNGDVAGNSSAVRNLGCIRQRASQNAAAQRIFDL